MSMSSASGPIDYRRGSASELIQLPDSIAEREAEARAALVEVLADHDDALLEKVVEDIKPTLRRSVRTAALRSRRSAR